MMRITVLLVCCMAAVISMPACADNPVSPLYRARLDITLAEWERGPVPPGPGGEEPNWWPHSLNPFSYCLGSICPQSYCLGSLCLESGCFGSGCVGSTCVGSACATSLCAGSACVGSLCGGSACYGTTMCERVCGARTPTNPCDPDPGGGSYTPLNCPER
jgi:hypothetical protein